MATSYDQWKSTDPTDAEPDWDGTRDPKAEERADDAKAKNDKKAMIQIFRSQLELYQRASRHQARPESASLLSWLADVIARGPRLASDEWLHGYILEYGERAAIEACAEAIGQEQAGRPHPEAA
jgi:hypothetical protein